MSSVAFRATETIGHVQGLGLRVTARAALDHAWSMKTELELACAVDGRPAPPSARVSVTMEECDPRAFDGFEAELRSTSGVEYGQALRRVLVCRYGIPGLHVARDETGSPVYAQWLVDASARDRLRARLPGPWRPLADDELIVEFAYTFQGHRGMGVMAAGMGRLVEIAARRGASVVYTYVRADNVPSLRGCAKVGFLPVRVVSTSSRLGFHRVTGVNVDGVTAAQWAHATAPRA